MPKPTDQILECSFCLKKQWEVKKLISGDNVYICNECVDSCHNILTTGEQVVGKSHRVADLDPQDIKTYLDEHIIGQDEAKEIISVAVSNHYKRLNNLGGDIQLDKSNIILIGDTGSGKTLLAKTLAKKLNVPLAIADATSITEAGYTGDDVESIISRLYAISGNNKARTETGIIFIDEIDKKARKTASNSTGRDISGEGVQQALLKLIEGDKVRIYTNGNKKIGTSGETVEIDTTNILFICGGSFVGLQENVNNRVRGGGRIGFSAQTDPDPVDTHVTAEDLISYGMIPELIGRLSIITKLGEITEDLLVRIISEPKNSIQKQFQKIFSIDGVELEFTDEAIKALAHNAVKSGTGARGLRSVIERILVKTQFNLTTLKKEGLRRVIVDSGSVVQNEQPKMVFDIDINSNT